MFLLLSPGDGDLCDQVRAVAGTMRRRALCGHVAFATPSGRTR